MKILQKVEIQVKNMKKFSLRVLTKEENCCIIKVRM